MPQDHASGAGRGARSDKVMEAIPRGAAFPPVYDEAQAHHEGWTVAECGPREDGSERVEIRRLGAGSRFADDESARHYVVTQARAGSGLRRAAIGVCDPLERKLMRVFCGDWQAAAGEDAP